MDAAVFTAYNIKNRSADMAVFVRANIDALGVTKGPWVRIRPLSEGVVAYTTGVAITQLEAFIPDSPRYVSPTGLVSHAQSAQIEITVR
jgi:hypothetical protein